MKLKINNVSGHKSGKVLEIKVKDGVPVCKFWRKRLKEAKIDNCVEVVKTRAKRKEKSK